MEKIFRRKSEWEPRLDACCQCALGHETISSASPLRPSVPQLDSVKAEIAAANDLCRVGSFSAPGTKPRTEPAVPGYVLVTCRFPGHFDFIIQHSFPSCTPMYIVKCKLAKLMKIPNCTLAIANGMTAFNMCSPISEYKNPAYDSLLVDVYVGDGKVPPEARPPPPYIEDIFARGADGRPVHDFIVMKFKVRIQDDNFTRLYPAAWRILDVKRNLAKIFKKDISLFKIYRLRIMLRDDALLWDLDYDKYGNLDTELVMRDSSKLDLSVLYSMIEVPVDEVIAVTAECGPCGEKMTLNVLIQDQKIKKPYLGGYQNVHTCTEYHHAYSQTPQKPSKVRSDDKRERDTQTAEEREKVENMPYERATQMSGAVYIPNITDKIMTARPYVTYDDMMAAKRYDHYAAIIQRAYRRWKFKQLVLAWLKRCMESIERMKEEDRLEKEAFETRLKRDLITKTFPMTREDFEHLYTMLERWRNGEIARISRMHSQGPKIAEFSLLLDKEVELLRRIEEYRVQVKENSKQIRDKVFLDEISKPVTWISGDGRLVTMHTVEAQRARKLRDLYEAFCREELSQDNRIALLVDFKYSIKDYLHPLCDDITDLLERECELIVRGYTDEQLEFLRKRTRAAIMQFIKTSELNAGVTRRREKAQVKDMRDGKVSPCEMCDSVKHYSDFTLQARTAVAPAGKAWCTSCAWMRTPAAATGSTDSGPYRIMLRTIRRDERRKRAWGSLAFGIQEKDLQYLIETLWHARSAIGGCDDLLLLRVCRWDARKEWSPWNCLVATLDEVRAHLKLEKPEEVYDEELVKAVKLRHELAKGHFRRLMAVESGLSGTNAWHAVRAKATDHIDGVEAL